MAVKKNVRWTGSEWSGFVNMGTEIGYDGDERDRPIGYSYKYPCLYGRCH